MMLGWGFPPKIEGGLDIHVANLFKELRAMDIDIDLALPEEYAPELPEVKPLESEADHILPKSRDMSSTFASLAQDYDIVHTHDWFGAEAGLKAKKYSDVKWISTVHSLSANRARGTNEEIHELEKVLAQRSDKVISVSKQLAREVEEEFGTPPQVVYNGFSKRKNSGRDLKKDLDIENSMIFFVGRHAEQKGLEHLLYGFKKFLEDNKGTLVIGGDGHLREALEDFAEILEIEENVIFEGFIPDEELGDYFNSADVFTSPSINEPFGLTITEALESGTPVVATKSGVNEIVESNGLVSVRPESDDICRGLEKALDREVGEIESRSWAEMAEETVDIYRKLS